MKKLFNTRSILINSFFIATVALSTACQKTVSQIPGSEELNATSLNAKPTPEDRESETTMREVAVVHLNESKALGDFEYYFQLPDGRLEVPSSALDPMYQRDNLKVEIRYTYSQKTVMITENEKPTPMIDLIYIGLVKTNEDGNLDFPEGN